MKVKELQILLAEAKPDAEIIFKMKSGCCSDFEYLDLLDEYPTEILNSYNEEGQYFEIAFDSLPGYESCISAGRMHDLVKQIKKERKERGF